MSQSLSEQYKIGFTPFLHILHVHHTYLQSAWAACSIVLLFTNQCIQGKNLNTSKSCQWDSPSVCRYQHHRSSACNTTTTTVTHLFTTAFMLSTRLVTPGMTKMWTRQDCLIVQCRTTELNLPLRLKASSVQFYSIANTQPSCLFNTGCQHVCKRKHECNIRRVFKMTICRCSHLRRF